MTADRYRRAFGVVLTLGCALATAAATAAPDASVLLSQLARPEPSQVRYFERNVSAVLIEPIHSFGSMSRPAPGVLEKVVESEPMQSMRIADGRVEVKQAGGKKRRFSLSRAPGLGLLATSFDALLSGDAETIVAQYKIEVEGDDNAWRMTLTPINSRLAKRVNQLVLAGGDSEWRCFDMDMGDGERSRLWLGDAAEQARALDTEDERDAICAAAAAAAKP